MDRSYTYTASGRRVIKHSGDGHRTIASCSTNVAAEDLVTEMNALCESSAQGRTRGLTLAKAVVQRHMALETAGPSLSRLGRVLSEIQGILTGDIPVADEAGLDEVGSDQRSCE